MANCKFCNKKLPHPYSIAGFCDNDCLEKWNRKNIEGYANMRSANGNLLEKALAGQTGQSYKVAAICSEPLTKEEKELLEYCLLSCAMSGKYITNRNINELVRISNKLGLTNAREIELCKD